VNLQCLSVRLCNTFAFGRGMLVAGGGLSNRNSLDILIAHQEPHPGSGNFRTATMARM